MNVKNFLFGVGVAMLALCGCGSGDYSDPMAFAEKYVREEIERNFTEPIYNEKMGFSGMKIEAKCDIVSIPQHGQLERITCAYMPIFRNDAKFYFPSTQAENFCTVDYSLSINAPTNIIDATTVQKLNSAARHFLRKTPLLVEEMPPMPSQNEFFRGKSMLDIRDMMNAGELQISGRSSSEDAGEFGIVEVYRARNNDGAYEPLTVDGQKFHHKMRSLYYMGRLLSKQMVTEQMGILAWDEERVRDKLKQSEEDFRAGRIQRMSGKRTPDMLTAEAVAAMQTYTNECAVLKAKFDEINRLVADMNNLATSSGKKAFAEHKRAELGTESLNALYEERKRIAARSPYATSIRGYGRNRTKEPDVLRGFTNALNDMANEKKNAEASLAKLQKNKASAERGLDRERSIQARNANSRGRKIAQNANDIANYEAQIAECAAKIDARRAQIADLEARMADSRNRKEEKRLELEETERAIQSELAEIDRRISEESSKIENCIAEALAVHQKGMEEKLSNAINSLAAILGVEDMQH